MMRNETSNRITEQHKKLAETVSRLVTSDGIHNTTIPNLRLFRTSKVTEPLHAIYEPSLLVIAQGSKLVMLKDEYYQYNPSTYLVTSVHLPITGKIFEASKEVPYLCIQINFTTELLIDIIKDSPKELTSKSNSPRGLVKGQISTPLLDAVIRLVNLLETPADIPFLSPLIVREILYRVLQNDNGGLIHQFAAVGSPAHSVAQVVRLIHKEYNQPLKIDMLAKMAKMSPSSFYDQFKKVTAMSPLQYQKMIRLQTARRLLFTKVIDASDAAYQVGYESPTQFNREYSRMFGLPPISDVKRMRTSLTPSFLLG